MTATTLTPRALTPPSHAPHDRTATPAGAEREPGRPGDERAWKCTSCGRTYCVCSRRRHRHARRNRR